ncbi:MAG: ISNCY family transposase [Candidatus Yonathbacteria bacterium CG_4_10_14_0_8_um_filter_43_17]|uniref:ISNCY family transposase n=1 Tax=Candidatus Yonathbacteria bacterium CG_4_10_14_0_8_um_filter_43_17 TaxID=1975099 RepID=A0A2M7Q628_9BACT|nr:MAG: ISNCY family transposase [Candidatus Yonathbacteria bacterium CG_4_10_14_0_8_um_filter_43_17]
MDMNITMSLTEIKKYDIIKKVIGKELNGSEAAEMLGLTVRHVRRLKRKVDKNGIKGLIHGNRGKPSNRRMPDNEKSKIADLIREHYSDFGPLLATEKLAERHKINRDKSTVRSIMIKEGIWTPKAKKKETHREWRQRKACKGEMIQYDGSYDHWFEDRGGEVCLLASIDDADSNVRARFDEHEGVEPTFNFWRGYIEHYGKPNSIYVDKFSTYSMNHKLAKENPDTLTQFERAMKELNIGIIHAHSPQAKGRVEKLFKTLQDRLTKELRLNGISTIKEANEFLEKVFLPKFNAKFMVEPRSKADLHKKLNEQEKNKLDPIFSRQYRRVVGNDFTVSHKKNCYQLEKIQPTTIYKQDIVIVEEQIGQAIRFRLRGKYLNYKLLPEKPKKINSSKNNLQWVIPRSTAHIPPANHPWRQISNIEYLKKLTKMSK